MYPIFSYTRRLMTGQIWTFGSNDGLLSESIDNPRKNISWLLYVCYSSSEVSLTVWTFVQVTVIWTRSSNLPIHQTVCVIWVFSTHGMKNSKKTLSTYWSNTHTYLMQLNSSKWSFIFHAPTPLPFEKFSVFFVSLPGAGVHQTRIGSCCWFQLFFCLLLYRIFLLFLFFISQIYCFCCHHSWFRWFRVFEDMHSIAGRCLILLMFTFSPPFSRCHDTIHVVRIPSDYWWFVSKLSTYFILIPDLIRYGVWRSMNTTMNSTIFSTYICLFVFHVQ